MSPTPPLPSWVRDYRTPSYTNIYQFDYGPCRDETRLYGTESLYGDWDAPLLILAKDFAPAALVQTRIAAGDPRPYRHTCWKAEPRGPGAQTNRNLHPLAEQIPCGKLYVSALAGLLRNDTKVSGELPDYKGIEAFTRDVLHFTISHMPNLRVIACLGRDAWRCAATSLDRQGVADEWGTLRDARQPVEAGRISLFPLAHTSRPFGGKAKVWGDWLALRDELQRRCS